MIVMGEILIADLAPDQRQPHHLSAASLGRLVAEGLCSTTKYRQKNCSIGSSVVVEWGVHSVYIPFLSDSFRGRLTYSGGGMFDTGPQFVFNMGGGPGFRVHQFGGGRPRRRPREANGQNDDRPQTVLGALSNLLPLLILFILPLLSSLFSSAIPSGPSIHFQDNPPNTMHRISHRLKVDYYINPSDVEEYSDGKFKDLDRRAENQYITNLQYECQIETRTRNKIIEDAQGWFFQDENKMREARKYDMRACKRLDRLGFTNGY